MDFDYKMASTCTLNLKSILLAESEMFKRKEKLFTENTSQIFNSLPRLSKIIQRHETKSISAIIHYHRTFEFEGTGNLGIKIVNALSKGKELLVCVIIGAFKH